jgi:integrase
MKDCEIAFDFQSGLAPHIKGFLEEKYLLGFKYTRNAYEMQSLDRFCRDRTCCDNLSKDIALAWVRRTPNQKAVSVNHKISAINEFAKYMNRQGLSAYVIPHNIAPKNAHDYTPYIFTHDDIAKILKGAGEIEPHAVSKARHLIMPVIFRLLYCCGLRVSEAVNLRHEDVDWKTGIIHLKHTKEFCDRLVPLNEQLYDLLIQYCDSLQKLGIKSDYLFPSYDGGHYHIFTIRDNFRELMWKAGIPYGGRGKGPRLHDLRHTFAVHSFERFLSEKKDPLEFLPILSVYMGHKNLSNTGRYIHLTPESFSQITAAFSEKFGHLFPKWEADYE